MPDLPELMKLNLSVSLSHPISCVLGAPGSGKTTQLRRAVLELEKAHHPDRILVLTPTRFAAATLRDEIALASTKPASGPRARSLSSFAFQQVSKNQVDLKLLSGPQQQQLLQDLVSASTRQRSWGLNPKALGLKAFTQELRDLFQVAMEFGLDGSALEALAAAHPELNLGPVIDLLPDYLAALEGGNYLDPSSLLGKAGQNLEPSFDWVLVDDAQDLSAAGLDLIGKLSAQASVLVFGDPDSGVQGFRSAEPGEFLRFGNLQFLNSVLPQPKLAQQLMGKFSAKLGPAGAGRQRAATATGSEQLNAPIFSSTSAEADYLAAKLRRIRLEQGTTFSEMAVVLRTQTQVDQVSRELAARKVPVRLSGSAEPVAQNQLTLSLIHI